MSGVAFNYLDTTNNYYYYLYSIFRLHLMQMDIIFILSLLFKWILVLLVLLCNKWIRTLNLDGDRLYR